MPEDKRPYPEKARARIKSSKILTRLQKHAMGELEMSSTQIQAARILLGKTLPDLSQVENAGETITRIVVDKETAKDVASGVQAAIRGK